MMNYLKVLLVFILLGTTASAQTEEAKDKYPNSTVDLSLGIGTNYGILGAKSVIGYRGTGLMLGVGRIEGLTTTCIGFQVTYLSWFANVSYATTGTYYINYFGREEEGLIKETAFLTGARISLNAPKTLFLEVGVGISLGGEVPQPIGPADEVGGNIQFGLGIGYRIGNVDL
jgi:hypothetical protein